MKGSSAGVICNDGETHLRAIKREDPRKRARIDEIKARTKCLACRLLGHWCKDNLKFILLMEENLSARGDKN